MAKQEAYYLLILGAECLLGVYSNELNQSICHQVYGPFTVIVLLKQNSTQKYVISSPKIKLFTV